MAAFSQDDQDEMTDRYLQEEADAAGEHAVELLNTLRDMVADVRAKRRPNFEAADSLIAQIEEMAHNSAQVI